MQTLDSRLTHSRLLSSIPGLRHGFTNLSITKEEMAALDAETATVKQVHGDVLLWADALEHRARVADGLATFKAGLTIGTSSADCTPVLAVALHSSTDKVYAAMAVHAGWRGTALGIAGKTLKEFAGAALEQDKNARFAAVIGPCIGPAKFEVGPDVISAFPSAEKHGLAHFLRQENGLRKYLFDLPGENLRQLKLAAAEQNIRLEAESLGLCTLELKETFPSYRRDGAKAGRILSFLTFEL